MDTCCSANVCFSFLTAPDLFPPGFRLVDLQSITMPSLASCMHYPSLANQVLPPWVRILSRGTKTRILFVVRFHPPRSFLLWECYGPYSCLGFWLFPGPFLWLQSPFHELLMAFRQSPFLPKLAGVGFLCVHRTLTVLVP